MRFISVLPPSVSLLPPSPRSRLTFRILNAFKALNDCQEICIIAAWTKREIVDVSLRRDRSPQILVQFDV